VSMDYGDTLECQADFQTQEKPRLMSDEDACYIEVVRAAMQREGHDLYRWIVNLLDPDGVPLPPHAGVFPTG